MRKGSKKLKAKKPKLEGGGLKEKLDSLNQVTQPIAQGAGMLGQVIDPMFKETNVAGKATSNALKMAGAGAAFGPIGAGVGLIGGAITGVIGASKAKKAEEEAARERRELAGNINTSNAFANAGNQFKHGGKILAKKLQVENGGSLKPVSDDAVEVKANNPNKSDSVELNDAFVDHNEIIDRKNRVYSDSIFLPNGKSIAKEAKKLEKQKAEDYELRFASANKHIDSKLDKLFDYQESFKKGGKIKKNSNTNNFTNTEPNPEYPDQMAVLQTGGIIDPNPRFIGPPTKKTLLQPPGLEQYRQERSKKFDAFYEQSMSNIEKAGKLYGDKSPQYQKAIDDYLNSDPYKSKGKMKKGGKLKPAYSDGTDKLFPVTPLASLPAMPKFVDKQGNAIGAPRRQEPNEQSSTTNTSFGDKLQSASTALATFGPNIAADVLRRKLKGPKTPFLEQGVRLKRLSPDAQLAAASQQTRQAQEIVRRSTAQGADAVAAQGSLLARRLSANNEIYGNVNNANAQIQAQEAGLNQSVRARNTERTNQFRDNQVEFNNKLQQLKSENIANLSSKILTQGRERNQMKLDAQKFDYISKQFGDSNVLSRLYSGDPKALEELNSQRKKAGMPIYEIGTDGVLKIKTKFGGYITKKLNKKK